MNRIGRDLFATCAVLLLVGAAEARLSGGGETLQPEKGPESQPMPSAPSRVASVPLRSLSARSHLLVGARANAYLLSDDDEPQYRAVRIAGRSALQRITAPHGRSAARGSRIQLPMSRV